MTYMCVCGPKRNVHSVCLVYFSFVDQDCRHVTQYAHILHTKENPKTCVRPRLGLQLLSVSARASTVRTLLVKP